jgi:hypothetical protein
LLVTVDTEKERDDVSFPLIRAVKGISVDEWVKRVLRENELHEDLIKSEMTRKAVCYACDATFYTLSELRNHGLEEGHLNRIAEFAKYHAQTIKEEEDKQQMDVDVS